MPQDLGVFEEDDARLILETVKGINELGILKPSVETEKKRGLEPNNVTNSLTPQYVRNDSGETIPAYSFMQVTGTVEIGGQNFFKVEKSIDPTLLRCPLLINSPREILDGETGLAQYGPVYRVKASTSYDVGDRLGPITGSWQAGYGSMYAVLGVDDLETNLYRVAFDTSTFRGRTKSGGLSPGTPALVLVYDATNTITAKEYMAETAVSAIPGNTEILMFSTYGRWFAVRLC